MHEPCALFCFAQGGGLHDMFTMVMAGLVATTNHMISCSVMALARLTYQFGGRTEMLLEQLLPPVLSLLRTKSREVVKAVFGFVKVSSRPIQSHVSSHTSSLKPYGFVHTKRSRCIYVWYRVVCAEQGCSSPSFTLTVLHVWPGLSKVGILSHTSLAGMRRVNSSNSTYLHCA